jgi:hypothetical protein
MIYVDNGRTLCKSGSLIETLAVYPDVEAALPATAEMFPAHSVSPRRGSLGTRLWNAISGGGHHQAVVVRKGLDILEECL